MISLYTLKPDSSEPVLDCRNHSVQTDVHYTFTATGNKQLFGLIQWFTYDHINYIYTII